MIKIEAERGTFEIRGNGEILELYLNGKCMGENLDTPCIKKGSIVTLRYKLKKAAAIRVCTTGIIKSVT